MYDIETIRKINETPRGSSEGQENEQQKDGTP
jgi:hypothetical protein